MYWKRKYVLYGWYVLWIITFIQYVRLKWLFEAVTIILSNAFHPETDFAPEVFLSSVPLVCCARSKEATTRAKSESLNQTKQDFNQMFKR